MKDKTFIERVPGSFRDPDGFLFYAGGHLYRQINRSYSGAYDLLMKSGLYEDLVNAKLLIPHEELESKYAASNTPYKVIKPEVVPFVSYPYEWCFSQLKDAALVTLTIQKEALKRGMSLKDASAYNIQFRNGKAVLVDTLSFQRYNQGQPWVAYRQFCQHFLAPLALMKYTDLRLSQFLRIYMDGIPLDLAHKLLPVRSHLVLPLLLHIHLHAFSQRRAANRTDGPPDSKMSLLSLNGLIDSLETAIRRIKYVPRVGDWTAYYADTNYSQTAFEEKKRLVSNFLDRIDPGLVLDLGSNVGLFSRIASAKGFYTVSLDADPSVVEQNYLECLQTGEENVLPLVVDLTNPSADIGWENHERVSLLKRGQQSTIMALALIHHLAISNNVPLSMLAGFFSSLCANLIVEFIPKNDSRVQQLLASRIDVFKDYTRAGFEAAFAKYFKIVACSNIGDSERVLFLMVRRETR